MSGLTGVTSSDLAVTSMPRVEAFAAMRRFLRLARRSPATGIAALVITCFIGVALFQAQIAGDPLGQDLVNTLTGPTSTHLFGTDSVGRDVYARVVYGTRLAFLIGVGTILIGAIPGVFLGLVAGYFGRFLDAVIMRFADILLSFPFFLLALVIVALVGASLQNTIIAVGITLVPSYIRLIRGAVLAVKSREYVDAARVVGCRDARIMRRYILPNVVSVILVHSALSLPRSIIATSSLSFLGLGAQPPAPEWGAMVSDCRNYLVLAPWSVFFPTGAIIVFSMAFNFLGDGLRDLLDPRMRRL